MKKPALIIAVLVLIILIWREFSKPGPVIEPLVANEVPAAAPTQAPARALPSRPMTAPAGRPAPAPASRDSALGRVMPATPPPAGGRQKPPLNSIPFVLVDGLVVSFGDQLLGRPTQENFPPEGFIEAPKVKPWVGAEVAYSFDPRFVNPERVQRVLAYFNEYTPVRFVPFTNQKDSLVFSPGQSNLCLSYVGMIGGHQPIYLDDRCYDKEITHEIMHALGFIHEHSRPDRDQFVRVNWDKIEEDKQSQFEAAPAAMAVPQKNRPFDFQSVMIYQPTEFARIRGDLTIESLTGAKIEPSASGLSPEDLARLVNLYAR